MEFELKGGKWKKKTYLDKYSNFAITHLIKKIFRFDGSDGFMA